MATTLAKLIPVLTTIGKGLWVNYIAKLRTMLGRLLTNLRFERGVLGTHLGDCIARMSSTTIIL
jgi:hypothetical protein